MTDKIELTYKEFAIISCLLVHAGQLWTASDPRDIVMCVSNSLQQASRGDSNQVERIFYDR